METHSATTADTATTQEPRGEARGGRVVVFGIGNNLMRDDAAGGLVVAALEERHGEHPQATWIDAGTIAFPLLVPLAEHDAVIVVDAARLGKTPGTVSILEGEEMDRLIIAGKHSSVHEVSLAQLFQAAALTETMPERRALVGIEPLRVDLGTEPSQALLDAIPAACEAVESILARWASPTGEEFSDA